MPSLTLPDGRRLKLGISTFEVVMAVLRKSPFSRMWPHVMWYTFTDPTEERTVSVFSTDGKGSSSWSSKIVSEILLDQMAVLPWILYLHHFLCLHFSDVSFSLTHCPVSSDAQVCGFWLTDQHLISVIKRTFLFLTLFKWALWLSHPPLRLLLPAHLPEDKTTGTWI